MMDNVYVELYKSGKCSQEDIALATNLSIMQVRQQLYKAGCELSQSVTEEWIEEVRMMAPEGTLEVQARQYCTDMLVMRKLKYGVSSERHTEDRTTLITAIVTGDKTQAEIAKDFNVSQATVSRHNPRRKQNSPYGPRLSPTTWLKVKEYLAKNRGNISEAARHFNTTRQTIYRKLKHDD